MVTRTEAAERLSSIEIELSEAEIDRIFQALADATRRDIVQRTLQRPQSVTVLAGAYAMSFAAVQKHVAVLERARLVGKTRRGREQIVHGDVDAIRRASRLLDDYARLWRGRHDRMAGLLAEPGAPLDASDARGASSASVPAPKTTETATTTSEREDR